MLAQRKAGEQKRQHIKPPDNRKWKDHHSLEDIHKTTQKNREKQEWKVIKLWCLDSL